MGHESIHDLYTGDDGLPPPVPCSNLAYDIQRLYDKDPLGNVLLDKKKLQKNLLLSYVCNTKAGELGMESQPILSGFFLEQRPLTHPHRCCPLQSTSEASMRC